MTKNISYVMRTLTRLTVVMLLEVFPIDFDTASNKVVGVVVEPFVAFAFVRRIA